MKYLRPILFVAASFGAALLLLVFHGSCNAQCPGGVCRPAAQPCPCSLGGPCLCAPGQCSCPGCQAQAIPYLRPGAPLVLSSRQANGMTVYYVYPWPASIPPGAGLALDVQFSRPSCSGGACHRHR